MSLLKSVWVFEIVTAVNNTKNDHLRIYNVPVFPETGSQGSFIIHAAQKIYALWLHFFPFSVERIIIHRSRVSFIPFLPYCSAWQWEWTGRVLNQCWSPSPLSPPLLTADGRSAYAKKGFARNFYFFFKLMKTPFPGHGIASSRPERGQANTVQVNVTSEVYGKIERTIFYTISSSRQELESLLHLNRNRNWKLTGGVTLLRTRGKDSRRRPASLERRRPLSGYQWLGAESSGYLSVDE